MAISASPVYPVIGEAVTVTSSTDDGTHAVLQLDTLPSSSALSAGLVLLPYIGEEPWNALEACERELNTRIATFDEPGEYVVTLYDIREIPGVPATENDRGGEYRFEYVATDTGTIHVGGIVDLPILTIDRRGATLRLQVNDTQIRDATLVDHTDDNSRAMAEIAAVTAALDILGGSGITAGFMGTAIIAGTNDLRLNYEAHRVVQPAVHNAADAVNAIARDPCNSLETAISLLNDLRTVLLAHMQVDQARTWHNVEDWTYAPLAAVATDMATATVLMTDLRERVYEVHRVDAVVHNAGDAVNDLTAPLTLDNVIVAYLDALVTVSPPILPGEPEGAQYAASNFGFRFRTEE